MNPHHLHMIAHRKSIPFIYFGIFLFVLFPGACTYDQEEMIPVFPEFPAELDCDYNIGAFSLLTSSLTYAPYIGIDSVEYVDSLGTKLVFAVDEREVFTSKGALIKYNVFTPGDTVRYCYQTESKTFFLENETENITFRLVIQASPNYADPAPGLVSDDFNIWYVNPDPPPHSSSQVFFATIALRTGTYLHQNIVIPQLDVFGQPFFDVETTNFSNPKLKVWYNRTEGIVSFIDPTGKRWRWNGFK